MKSGERKGCAARFASARSTDRAMIKLEAHVKDFPPRRIIGGAIEAPRCRSGPPLAA
jgi:hypothetical protein